MHLVRELSQKQIGTVQHRNSDKIVAVNSKANKMSTLPVSLKKKKEKTQDERDFAGSATKVHELLPQQSSKLKKTLVQTIVNVNRMHYEPSPNSRASQNEALL